MDGKRLSGMHARENGILEAIIADNVSSQTATLCDGCELSVEMVP